MACMCGEGIFPGMTSGSRRSIECCAQPKRIMAPKSWALASVAARAKSEAVCCILVVPEFDIRDLLVNEWIDEMFA